MKRRVYYFAKAAQVGWGGLRHPVENVTLATSVAGLVGVPTAVGVAQGAGIAGILVGLFVALLAVVFEGAYRLWRQTAERDQAADTFYAACSTWLEEVEKFLEVRKATRPDPPKRDLVGALAGLRVGKRANQPPPPPDPHVVAAEQEIAAHDRQTLALYIEKYRDRGLVLYDALVSLGVLRAIEANRRNVRAPNTEHQISSGLSVVRLGAESDLRRYL